MPVGWARYRRRMASGAALGLAGALVQACQARDRQPGAAAGGELARAQSVQLVTRGVPGSYSQELNRLVFSRFNTDLAGGPDLDGKHDNTGTYELWVAGPDGANEVCLSCRDVPG